MKNNLAPFQKIGRTVSFLGDEGRLGVAFRMPPLRNARSSNPLSVEQFEAGRLASNFLHGNLGSISELFSFPCIVYVGTQVLVIEHKGKLIDALSIYRSVLLDAWLSTIISTVTDSKMSDGRLCRIAVENQYYSVDGQHLGKARINYYCEGEIASPKICMVEYLALSPHPPHESSTLVAL